MSPTIFAAFSDPHEAQIAAGALIEQGIKSECISLIVSPEYEAKRNSVGGSGDDGPHPESVVRTPGGVTQQVIRDSGVSSPKRDGPADAPSPPDGNDPQKREDPASLAKVGALVGLSVGTAAALAAIAIPGFGIIIGGGALAAAVAAIAATGHANSAVAGVTGYLKDQGVPAAEIHHFETAYTGGGAILAIHVDACEGAPKTKAESIVRDHNPQHLAIFSCVN